jgi:anthranilate synthase component 2
VSPDGLDVDAPPGPILVIDNYDSFTFNLVQYVRACGWECDVRRNDAVTVSEAVAARPAGVIVSPGPGDPAAAGVSVAIIAELGDLVPVLGVCLGHQCIAEAFGCRVVKAPAPYHGKTSFVWHDGKDLFEGLPVPFEAMRYHSLVVERSSVPDSIDVCAETAEGIVMALRSRTLPVYGIQFHPESVLTYEGRRIVENFLQIVRAWAAPDHLRHARPTVAGGTYA